MRNRHFNKKILTTKLDQKIVACLTIACVSGSSYIGVASAQSSNSAPQSTEQPNPLKDKVSELAQQIISAVNEVELTGDFTSAAKKRNISDVNLTPILKRI